MVTMQQTAVDHAAVAPGPRGNWLLGSLPEARRDTMRLFLEGARDYGDIVRFRFGNRVGHLLRHPDYVKHVLQDNFKNYGKQTRGFITLRETLGQGLLTSEGTFWLRQRRIAQPAFHPQRIAGFSQAMTVASVGLADRWSTRPQGTVVDIGAEMMQLALRIVGQTLLSTDVSDDAGEIGQALTEVLHYTIDHITRVADLSGILPTGRRRRFLAAKQKLDDVVYGLIAARRKSGEDAGDLLSMLMLARDEETGEGMTDTQLRDEVMTLFLAGHETTANALTWTWYLLSMNPGVARSLHAELDSVLGGRVPTLADLPKLTYNRHVIDEALRVYPPAWMIARSVIADDTIGGYPIPAKSIVFMSSYVTHRHPDFWPNPEGFDPDRFAGEAAAGRHKFAYFPFGGGPRLCIGRDFALMEAQLILAILAQRFRLDLQPGPPIVPEPLVTLRPKGGMRMALFAR